MKKVVRVVGTRPQYMQVPKLKRMLEAEGIRHVLIHTGQHYDTIMADTILSELDGIRPDINLSVGSGRHGQMTGAIMAKLEEQLLEVKPDFVVVDGDTNSTLATALVTSKLRIPLAHIEAGLRDFDRNRPEEINRILTDHAAELCLAPIPRALENLRAEGLSSRSALVGDFLLDNFVEFTQQVDLKIYSELNLSQKKYGIMTLHRPENTNAESFDRFFEILDFAEALPFPMIFPVHPRTAPAVKAFKTAGRVRGNIKFIDSVSYLELLGLLKSAEVVFTDSGGLSREAVWMGVRCLMFFRVDTWHDLLERGWAGIAKGGADSIRQSYDNLKTPPLDKVRAFYGGGRAAENSIELLKKHGWV